MKIIYLSFLMVFLTVVATAQENDALDTILANDHKNVALFFPGPIRQGITGNKNFVFSYNRDKEQYFGLLQATPGTESNLLVIDRNGAIFSYIVKYAKKLKKLNYFVQATESIGNEKPDYNSALMNNDSIYQVKYRGAYYQRFCHYLVNQKHRITRLRKDKENITLSVDNIVFDRDEFYFVIQIDNRSSLAYDLNFLELSIQTRQKGKKKSLQTLQLKPKYVFDVPERINEHETKRCVLVVPKFSLDEDRGVVLELKEISGGRDLKLKISHTDINNPN
ncbi:DUF4138 domain-containing protein [Flavobacteriaceae bacterium F89]|uniref:DUF4138 domain-containing protein n=1 Tax=Cerina litoralis TaxID=2874477 RepID=A0AAE3F059_9FLAO|nr:DUF4138 domain-containing protein [Cerina litoralis]MCG2462846.1 DUF4138 domain-containing protein [Cerina litoralis]